MKTILIAMLLMALCINCNSDNPPSTTVNTKDTNSKLTSTSRNTIAFQKPEKKNPSAMKNGNALTVYLDPQTGEFIPPKEAEIMPEERFTPFAVTGTLHDGLEERPSTVPGGGTMVDLKGRFQSPLTATIDSSGQVMIKH